jgi:hypothetical protein
LFLWRNSFWNEHDRSVVDDDLLFQQLLVAPPTHKPIIAPSEFFVFSAEGILVPIHSRQKNGSNNIFVAPLHLCPHPHLINITFAEIKMTMTRNNRSHHRLVGFLLLTSLSSADAFVGYPTSTTTTRGFLPKKSTAVIDGPITPVVRFEPNNAMSPLGDHDPPRKRDRFQRDM